MKMAESKIGRILRVALGLAIIAYGFYSGNSWFYLGVMPLLLGLVNCCPINKLIGGCKDGCCSTVSCETTNNEEERNLHGVHHQKNK